LLNSYFESASLLSYDFFIKFGLIKVSFPTTDFEFKSVFKKFSSDLIPNSEQIFGMRCFEVAIMLPGVLFVSTSLKETGSNSSCPNSSTAATLRQI